MIFKMEDQKVSDNKMIIFIEGELDLFTIESVIKKIDDISAENCELDLERVTFIDSSGIGLLIRKIIDWKDESRVLTVTKICPSIYEVLDEMGAFAILEEVYNQ